MAHSTYGLCEQEMYALPRDSIQMQLHDFLSPLLGFSFWQLHLSESTISTRTGSLVGWYNGQERPESRVPSLWQCVFLPV